MISMRKVFVCLPSFYNYTFNEDKESSSLNFLLRHMNKKKSKTSEQTEARIRIHTQ